MRPNTVPRKPDRMIHSLMSLRKRSAAISARKPTASSFVIEMKRRSSPFSSVYADRLKTQQVEFGAGSARKTRLQRTSSSKSSGPATRWAHWFADTVDGAAHAAPAGAVQEAVRQNRQNDMLVVSKLDRLGRDAPDVLANFKALASLGTGSS
jgi:hypothetical protein